MKLTKDQKEGGYFVGLLIVAFIIIDMAIITPYNEKKILDEQFEEVSICENWCTNDWDKFCEDRCVCDKYETLQETIFVVNMTYVHEDTFETLHIIKDTSNSNLVPIYNSVENKKGYYWFSSKLMYTIPKNIQISDKCIKPREKNQCEKGNEKYQEFYVYGRGSIKTINITPKKDGSTEITFNLSGEPIEKKCMKIKDIKKYSEELNKPYMPCLLDEVDYVWDYDCRDNCGTFYFDDGENLTDKEIDEGLDETYLKNCCNKICRKKTIKDLSCEELNFKIWDNMQYCISENKWGKWYTICPDVNGIRVWYSVKEIKEIYLGRCTN